ncbi:hypothetical protein E2562_006764 [Oryza meyeriana var. granulata]|uniref:Uncharacterized protein n=1 Tax=Oryza meyeriana var. granulata TaxID=110450 RepID=A0A6G1C4G8_9ORYZ|nr:hypothetical protein E2562_006764 [Oryza meyeriana var. granulata]
MRLHTSSLRGAARLNLWHTSTANPSAIGGNDARETRMSITAATTDAVDNNDHLATFAIRLPLQSAPLLPYAACKHLEFLVEASLYYRYHFAVLPDNMGC